MDRWTKQECIREARHNYRLARNYAPGDNLRRAYRLEARYWAYRAKNAI